MKADQLERAAYMAAHRILTTNTGAPELACPGARRSHAVDVIANVIRDVFELHCADPEEITQCLQVLEGRAAPGTNVSERHKMGVVLELPQRALS
jgi:hypothetical protein